MFFIIVVGYSALSSNSLLCYLCHLPGATLNCYKKSCQRSFHLPCAIACDCSLYDAKMTTANQFQFEKMELDGIDSMPFDLHVCLCCPEHVVGGGDFFRLLSPELRKSCIDEPLRRVVVDEFYDDCRYIYCVY